MIRMRRLLSVVAAGLLAGVPRLAAQADTPNPFGVRAPSGSTRSDSGAITPAGTADDIWNGGASGWSCGVTPSEAVGGSIGASGSRGASGSSIGASGSSTAASGCTATIGTSSNGVATPGATAGSRAPGESPRPGPTR